MTTVDFYLTEKLYIRDQGYVKLNSYFNGFNDIRFNIRDINV